MLYWQSFILNSNRAVSESCESFADQRRWFLPTPCHLGPTSVSWWYRRRGCDGLWHGHGQGVHTIPVASHGRVSDDSARGSGRCHCNRSRYITIVQHMVTVLSNLAGRRLPIGPAKKDCWRVCSGGSRRGSPQHWTFQLGRLLLVS